MPARCNKNARLIEHWKRGFALISARILPMLGTRHGNERLISCCLILNIRSVFIELANR